MRMKAIIGLGLLLWVILSICGTSLSAQTVMTFKYGEREEYEGQLKAYVFILGQDRVSKERISMLLTAENHSVDLSRYDQLMVVLQLTDFTLADTSHYRSCWLEIPLQAYFNKRPPGLDLRSKTVVVTIGDKSIPQARETADIRFTPAEGLKGTTAGKIDFSFDFISSQFPWRKIPFRPTLPYILKSHLSISEAENPEASGEQQAAFDDELDNDYEPESRQGSPSFENPSEEEVDLMADIQQENDSKKVLSLCEKYTNTFPDGHFTEEVLYKQITHASGPEDKRAYLETYLRMFPEGKYLLKVNEAVLAEFPEMSLDYKSPKGVSGRSKSAVEVDFQVAGGILAIDKIEGGQPPYRLEFYEVDDPDFKSYVLYIGENHSFQTNLHALPLEKDKYVIGLVDASQSTLYLSKPVSVNPSDRKLRVEGSFIFMVLGGAILAVALSLLLISNFFRKKRRRKRGHYSRSYR